MVLESTIIVDARDHLYGRLASVVAKELLAGQKVVVVRCDELVISGSLVRNRTKWAQFRKKHMNTNPRKGPFHFKAPAKMFWRTVRGMVNHMSDRGAAAIARLSTFEGIPHPYDKQQRKVVTAALRVTRLKPNRNFTVIGDLASSVGWKHKDLLASLEAKRKVKSAAFYAKKQAKALLKDKATKAADLTKVNAVLSVSGY
mmetsp:Transcript_13969/g.25610  ORF Transcript_13969/g.25610 Transcript_13969/m.25610 type:complete len:200 (-) Transcript_13969:76-675(-)|eukprot:CAMPEP_0182499186 /NCGR_PEP_ID=MMETSP1321-20130603/7304_1 /TAXON_ID=91990 /ORGANISM="Bolidomonas sp., Strain RCC1657" /LENGTH=199 /DNA_ID=CAMNT_0024703337 /DNA_START=25 /DNA_END=624 /DNA_ORIENTATION=+